MELAVLLVFIGILCGALAAAVSRPETKGLGFLLGFVLGPIGIVVAAILAKNAAPQTVVYQPGPQARLTMHEAAPDPSARSVLDEVPASLTIRREGEIIG